MLTDKGNNKELHTGVLPVIFFLRTLKMALVNVNHRMWQDTTQNHMGLACLRSRQYCSSKQAVQATRDTLRQVCSQSKHSHVPENTLLLIPHTLPQALS